MPRPEDIAAAIARFEVNSSLAQVRRDSILAALAGLLLLTAYGLGVAALSIFTAGYLGTVGALIVVAGAAALLGIVALIAMKVSDRRERARRRRRADALASAGIGLVPIVLRSHPLVLAAAAGGLAYLAHVTGSGEDDADTTDRRGEHDTRAVRDHR